MAEAENWLRLSKEKLQGEAEAKSVPARDRCLRARHPQTSTRSWPDPPDLITGFVQISPTEINLKHPLSLIATIGRAFGNVALYAGGGPALFGVETNFFNGIPFAVSPGPFSLTFPASVPTTFFKKLGVGRRGAGWRNVCLRPRLVGCKLYLCAVC
jgi:hypothetical protein